MKTKLKKMLVNLLILVLVFSNTGMNFSYAGNAGTTTTWIGGTDSKWDESSNWSDGAPQSTVDIILDGTTNAAITLDGSSASLVGGVAAVYNLTVLDSGASGVTINMVNNPTLMVNRDFIATNLTITGTGTLRVGERGGAPYAGDCTLINSRIASGVTIDVSGDLVATDSTFYNSTVVGNMSMVRSTGYTATVTGNLSLDDSDITYWVYNVGGNVTMTNNSSLPTVQSISGALSTTGSSITSLYRVTGNMAASQSTITMQSNGAIGGSVSLADTSTLNGRLISIGNGAEVKDSQMTLSNNGGNTLSITGNLTMNNGDFNLPSGSATVSGNVDLSNTSTLVNGSYTIQVGGTTTVDATSNMTLNSGYAIFVGDVNIAAGSTLTLTGYNRLTLQNDFINDGTLVANSYNRITASNGTLKLNNVGTPLQVDYLNTNAETLESTELEFIRNDAAGFTHVGNLVLNTSKIDATKLRMDQVSYTTQTITVNNGSYYLFEAIGKFSDASRNIISSIDNGSDIYVTIEDKNRSITQNPDTLQVTVTSPTGDSELLTLTETNGTSGIFINTSPLSVAIGAGNAANNGTINITAKDENLSAVYTDGDESLTIRLVKPYVVWDGAVSTDWYTTGNWTAGKVPNSTDNVLITGSRGPYVSTTLTVLAFDTSNDFTGSIQLYGSATTLESMKLLSGSTAVSSKLIVNQDVYVRNAQTINIYGYNNSNIKGKVDADQISNSLTLSGDGNDLAVDGTTTISNVSGSTSLTYLHLKNTANIHDNANVSLRYSTLDETAQFTGNTSVSSYENQYTKATTMDLNTSTNLQYDHFSATYNLTHVTNAAIYDSSFSGNVVVDTTTNMNIDYSDFVNMTMDAVDGDIYDSSFSGTTDIAFTNDLSYSYNYLNAAQAAVITADVLTLGRENQFYSDATLTGTTIDFTGSPNSSNNTKDWTDFDTATVNFVGNISSDPSIAFNVNAAVVNFPSGTTVEMIDLRNQGVSKITNMDITLPRDEYVGFTNSGTLTLDNTQIHAEGLLTNDISQTGTLTKVNGGTYSTQGQGYFGDVDGNYTNNIGGGTLYFYLYDHDKNTTTNADTISVQINGTGQAYTLTETGANTGLFSAAINAGDVSDTVYVTYEGRKNAYKPVAYEWSGAVDQKEWYTPGNWVGGVVPLEFDNVLLQGTTDTIEINDVTTIRDLTLDTTFTGTLKRKEGTLTTQNFTQNKGTFADAENRNHNILVKKNLAVTGGTMTKTASNAWTVTNNALFQNTNANIYYLTVLGNATVQDSILSIPYYLSVTNNLTFNGTYTGGTIAIGANGKFTFQDGTMTTNTIDNNGTLDFEKGKLTTSYLYQDKDMNQFSGEIIVQANNAFAANSLFTIKSGKFTVTTAGSTGNFGNITMDGGTFDAYGYGNYSGDLTINSGKMKINSKGNNYTTLSGDITVGNYGTLNIGSNLGWSAYNMYGKFASTGTYEFGNNIYLYLYSGVDFDLQNKLLEVYYLSINNNATVALKNGTLKVKNSSGSTFIKNSGSIMNLTNAILDVSRSYVYTYSGGSINLDPTSQFIRKTSGMNIVDVNGNVAPHLFTFGNTMYFLVEDDSANLNAGAAENVTLLYKNMTSHEEETVTLTEISNNSKKFRGSIDTTAITLGAIAAISGTAEGSNGRGTNKVLNFKDQIILRYIDQNSERGNDIFEVAFNAAKMALGSDDVSINASTMDFGINYVDEFKTSNITIYNRGDITLTVDELSIEGDAAANFKFAGSGTSRIRLGDPIKVAPKSQVVLPMIFEAATPGVKTGTLKLKSNDLENATLSISMTGTAGYRPLVVQNKVDAASYSGTAVQAGTKGIQTIDVSEFFVGRNNQDPLSIRVAGNSNTSLFDTFSYNAGTKTLTYTLKTTNGVADVGKATISLEATDTLGFSAHTSFGINVFAADNADLLNLNLVDADGNPVGTWTYSFDAETSDYDINVPVSVATATIAAVAVNPNSDITGDGSTNISMGNNTKTVSITSEDGTVTQNYVLHITRETATFTASGLSALIFESGKESKSISIDESIRVNGAQKIEVTFTSGFLSNQDALIYQTTTGSSITDTYDSATGKLTLTGTAQTTAKEYNDILKTIRYENNATTPTSGNKGIRFSLYYGNAVVATQNRTISVNNPPIAIDQTFLHIAQNGNLLKDVNVSDADGDTLTVEIVTQPMMESDNTVSMNGKKFTYTPKSNVFGLDSFIYRVFDGKSYSDFATVTINLVDINNQGNAPLVIESKVNEANYLENHIDGFEVEDITIDLRGLFQGRNNSDPLTFKIVSNSNPQLFESFGFNELTNMLTYRIQKNTTTAAIGAAEIIVEAMDSIGYFSNATISAVVVEYTDTDEDGIPNDKDTDDDNDGTPDTNDGSPLDPNLPNFDGDKDGTPDTTDPDDDNDGVLDVNDPDDDNDGILDVDDNNPTNPGLPYYDGDKDGLPDYQDPDDDNDGIADTTDTDDDNDGILDGDDSNPTNPDLPYADNDHDGIPNNQDPDDDNDGIPDVTDPDDDNDGVIDTLDLNPKNGNIPYFDGDKDGTPDYQDTDDDNDGILDVDDADDDNDGITDDKDNTPTNPNLPHYDEDKDGTPDYLDLDDDNDGLPDATDPDDDNDGVNDDEDIAPTNPDLPYYDGDKDGTPDYQDTDDDNDNILDVNDPDDDNDGVNDDEDIAPTNPNLPYYDGDKDGTADYLDTDDDNDSILDTDDPDDDNDGVTDDKDIAPTNPNVPKKVAEAPQDSEDINTSLDNALATVKIGYLQGDSASNVNGNVTLPITSVDSLKLTWTSTKENIIDTDGSVVRPLLDTVVKLTVRIEKDGYFRQKDYYLTVNGTSTYDEATDKAALNVGYVTGDSAASVTKDVYLTKLGNTGGIITWSSNQPAVISNTGKVERPGPTGNDINVTLTATIKNPDTNATTTKDFVVTVPKLTAKEATEEAARKLVITDAADFALGDIWESVTENFILLETGAFGTAITWTSSNPSVIEIKDVNNDITGAVHRATTDTRVIITATFGYGGETSTKSFMLLVKSSSVTKEVADVRQDSLRTADLTGTVNGTESSDTTTIFRTELSDGTKIDTVVIEGSDFDNLASNINPDDTDDANRTAVITIDDPVVGAADEYALEIQAGAINTLADKNAQLKIETSVATIFIESDSLKDVADEGTDLYFRVRPITSDVEKSGLVYTIKTDAAVSSVLAAGEVAKAISTPMKIETNMNGVATKIRVPLAEISSSIPTESAQARDTFLQSLSIFVAHSDGENKVYTPTIVYDGNGSPIALEFEINKFSSFQIIQPVKAPEVSSQTGLNKDVVMSIFSLLTIKNSLETNQNVLVKLDDLLVTLQPDVFDIATIKNQFGAGVNENDITIRVEKSVVTDTQLQSINQLTSALGAKVGSTPFKLVVKAIYGTKEYEIPLQKAMTISVPASQGQKITTAILVDGQKIYHQPTYITITNGNYQAQVNSFETGIFVLIWQELTFADIQKHWSKDIIENMASREIVFGNTQHMAEPDREITRAEFVALLIRSLGFTPVTQTIPFIDVSKSAWYKDNMMVAISLNLIKGYGDDTFRPNNVITRQEAMTIVSRAMLLTELKSKLTVDEMQQLLKGYQDSNLVQSWAQTAVQETLATGVVIGRGTELAVQEHITRAEAITMLERLLKKSGFIDEN